MLKQYTIAAILLASLTACSSGGSSTASHDNHGSHNLIKGSTDAMTAKQVHDFVEDTFKPQTSNPGETVLSFGGAYFHSDKGEQNNFGPAMDIDSLEIMGQKFPLLLSKPITGTFGKLNYSSFGVFLDPRGDNDYGLSFGKLTPEDKIPATGKVMYEGSASYGSEKLEGWVIGGKSSFQVDFGQKTVDGVITVPSHNIELKLPTAKIEGATFKYRGHNQKITGNFYGDKAQEMGGVVDLGGQAAVFGATRK